MPLYLPVYSIRSMASHLAIRSQIMLTGIIRIVLLSNLIEEGTVQCLDLATGNTAGQDGDTLAREVRNRKGDTLVC